MTRRQTFTFRILLNVLVLGGFFLFYWGSSKARPKGPVSSKGLNLAMPREDLEGLKNFAKISNALYRGAQPGAEGFRTLKDMGVKTIVNLRHHHHRAIL